MNVAEAAVVLAIAVPVLALVWALVMLDRIRRHQIQVSGLPNAGGDSNAPTSRDAPTASQRSVRDTTTVLRDGGVEPDWQPGAIVGSRYRIDRLIGSGGMGAVYEAWDQELEAPIALKVTRATLSEDPAKRDAFARRFKQELQLARRITHRNVLRIHDFGNVDGVMYITMPYVEGGDLARLLSERPLEIGRALSLGRQLVEGLAAAHEVGIVHRDLKPQNVLVDRDDHVYISDFGLAKSLLDTDLNVTRTSERHFTPRYVSPEQIEGKPADLRSDVYAAGLILYEMVTGSAAFSSVLSRLTELPKEPCDAHSDIPAHVNRLVMRCLQRDPELRYRNAQEILADLNRGALSAPAP